MRGGTFWAGWGGHALRECKIADEYGLFLPVKELREPLSEAGVGPSLLNKRSDEDKYALARVCNR